MESHGNDSFPSDGGSSHRHRRRLCRVSPMFTTVALRTLLLFGIPLFQCILLSVKSLNGTALDDLKRLSHRFWGCLLLSSLGWSFERIRRHISITSATSATWRRPVPFLSLFFVLLIAQCLYVYVGFSEWDRLDTASRFSAADIKGSVSSFRPGAFRTRPFLAQTDVFSASQAASLAFDADVNFENVKSNELRVYSQDVNFTLNDIDSLSAGIIPLSQLNDVSLEGIVAAHQERSIHGIFSVIFVAHNEHLYMTRTLESLVRTTEPGLLRDVVIVDDFSTPALSTSYDTTLFSAPLVTVVRHPVRNGLIQSRIDGGEASKGSVLVFLDAHVKPEPGWTLPILRHVNANPKRVVLPLIPILNGTTWEADHNAVGKKMMFDWNFGFYWIGAAGDKVPVMSGGLFAITRSWWEESGRLDAGMRLWGGENIEQSLRIWLCGGEIVVEPKCVISHVFRQSFPYSLNTTLVNFNKLRVAEVWLDKYKTYFYRSSPQAIKARWRPPIPIPHIGDGSAVHPLVEAMEPYVNISERTQLRERLKCKPFQTYVDQFEDVFLSQRLLPVEVLHIRNEQYKTCLTAVENSQKIILKRCDPNNNRQKWFLRHNKTGFQSLAEDVCFDAALSLMPVGTLLEEHLHSIAASSRTFSFITFPCDRRSPSQSAWSLADGRLHFASFCVEARLPNKKNDGLELQNVVLTVCKNGVNSTQQRGTTISVPENQAFEPIFKSVVSAEEWSAMKQKTSIPPAK